MTRSAVRLDDYLEEDLLEGGSSGCANLRAASLPFGHATAIAALR